MQRLKKLLFLLLLAVAPAYFLIRLNGAELFGEARFAYAQELPVMVAVELSVKEHMPFATPLAQLGLDLRMLGGQTEQNGIFISETGLMRNIDPPIAAYVEENTRAIADFSRQLAIASGKQTYLAVIPTAAGVLQQNLPRFAAVKVNQKRLIEELYNGVSSDVQTVDVFSQLDSRRDQYLYYRTENNLTALGGYYTYSAIVHRLQIGSNRSLSQFDIEYVSHDYYGDLYQSSSGSAIATAPYRKVAPDILSLFRFSGNREYTVTLQDEAGKRTYHTLYPLHCMQLGSPLDVYLGGSAGITTIRSSSPKKQRLLVFGDKTAQAYLPFLANHYQQVTLVNLYQADTQAIQALDPAQYDSVLFAYGIEGYIHTNHPAKVREVVWQDVG